MTLKEIVRDTLDRAAGLYDSGQCRFITRTLWRPQGNLIPEKPEAACMLGAIYHAAGATDAPAISAATAAVATACTLSYGIDDGRTNIVNINDEFIPRIRTGPGLAFANAEALAARILKHAAQLIGELPEEFGNTDQGAAELIRALDHLEETIMAVHGPVIVHNGFSPTTQPDP